MGAYYLIARKIIGAGLINRPTVEMISDQLDGIRADTLKDDVTFGLAVSGNTN